MKNEEIIFNVRFMLKVLYTYGNENKFFFSAQDENFS